MSTHNRTVYEVSHPMLTEYVMLLRDERCGSSEYRRCMKELSFLLAYEALNIPDLNIPTIEYEVTAAYSGEAVRSELIDSQRIALIPLLRSGLVMTGSMADMLPASPIGHLGYERDRKTGETKLIYNQLPEQLNERVCWVVDATISTGNSIVNAIKDVRAARGDDPNDKFVENIVVVSIIAAPEGINHIHDAYPSVPIITCSVEKGLDKHNYVIPGIGDCGARLYRTVNKKASPVQNKKVAPVQ